MCVSWHRRVVIAVIVATVALGSCTTDRPADQDRSDEVTATTSGDAETAAFCDQAVRILDLNPGDDPLVMDRQMARLEEAARPLEAGTATSLLRTIDRVRSEIKAVIESPEPRGWSSVPVAQLVSVMCNEPDLIGWTIQP